MKTWVETALNGPWRREHQPRLPVGVEQLVAEGIACADAGAAIVHLHAFDENGKDDVVGDVYARIIEGIRAERDCLVYPSIPTFAAPGVERFGHLRFLVERGLLELTVVDPGSVNLFPENDSPLPYPSLVYANSPAEIAEGLAYCADNGVHPGFAVYEPGFTRAGAALVRARPGVPQPIYRFMFSDDLAFGFRPGPAGIDAHLAALQTEAPGAPWLVAGLGLDVLPLVEHIVHRGGGVRTGLEDARFGCAKSNVELTRELVEAVVRAGSSPAGAAEVRAELKGAK
ncbi:3-keto-5-aminohexanoate cleavage protein [Amycolatopsis rhabdoformis]|uniref:3-keto-5-aminohexanoate cleavage protein n=1 Tax=Amycolatopsis rhabdoformis TaxID=1448059 RepID=A0ABZ1ILX8_9PSEU|nr:3-keto-5-aminohexanoate cleavage protein [Amycolatopsis rhabdoformis]WSE34761.1 3-keto-5-aminohexanoate cleavage protein [Amycolatopsis rhabdoformis]